jgi:glutathione peroxidase
MLGKTVKLKDYSGKVLLIVNTASKCGFTPQFEGLEQLYKTYKDRGLVIIGFPCNQFMNQDPESNKEIENFCKLRYGVTFPLSQKIEVKGENAHPLFIELSHGKSPKWNFTKFLIDRNGDLIKRFSPMTKPKKIEPYIEQLL